jgi:predicted Zn-ribbon and HTH transcriptional regulator
MTLRQQIMAALNDEVLTARDLSQMIRISEKEVLSHLSYVAKSIHPPKRFLIIPSVCNHCGFVFEARRRLTAPSGCPQCRHEGVSPPAFGVQADKE